MSTGASEPTVQEPGPAAPVEGSVRVAAVGLGCAIGSGLLFSVSTVAASKALDEGLPVSLVSGARIVVGCLVLWVASLLTGRQRIPGWSKLRLMATGVLTATQVYLLYQSVQRTSPSLAVLLLYSYPTLVALLSGTFLRERLRPVKVIAVALSVAGTVLIVGLTSGHANLIGCLFGLGSGLALAIYIVLISRVAAGVAPLTATSWLQFGAMITIAPVMLIQAGPIRHLGGLGWMAVVGISAGLAAALFLASVQRVTTTVASIASTVEPVSTAALSALFLGVTLAGSQLVGGALLVAALLTISVSGLRRGG